MPRGSQRSLNASPPRKSQVRLAARKQSPPPPVPFPELVPEADPALPSPDVREEEKVVTEPRYFDYWDDWEEEIDSPYNAIIDTHKAKPPSSRRLPVRFDKLRSLKPNESIPIEGRTTVSRSMHDLLPQSGFVPKIGPATWASSIPDGSRHGPEMTLKQLAAGTYHQAAAPATPAQASTSSAPQTRSSARGRGSRTAKARAVMMANHQRKRDELQRQQTERERRLAERNRMSESAG